MVIKATNTVSGGEMESAARVEVKGNHCNSTAAALPLFGPPPSPPCSRPGSVRSNASSPELNGITAMDIPRGPVSNFCNISLQTRLVDDPDQFSSDTATGSSGSPRSPRMQHPLFSQGQASPDKVTEPERLGRRIRRNLNISTGHRWRWLAVRASVRFSGDDHSNLARFCGLQKSQGPEAKARDEELSDDDDLLIFAMKANAMLRHGYAIGRNLWNNLQVIDNQASLNSFSFPDSDTNKAQKDVEGSQQPQETWGSTALKGLSLLISKDKNSTIGKREDNAAQDMSECGSVSGPKSSPQTPSHASSPDSWTDIISPLKASLQATVSSIKSSAITDLNKLVQSLPGSRGETAASFFNLKGNGENVHKKRTIVTVDGHMYEGSFLDGVAHGYGRMSWPDGQWFQGEFLQGKSDGLGRRVWNSGHEYVGEEHRGFRHGVGIMCWPSGKRYEGEFRMDMKEGIGLLWSNSGKFYVGSWSKNEQHGFGLEHEDGSFAFVEYVRGKQHKRLGIPVDLQRRIKANLNSPDEMSLLPRDLICKLLMLPLPEYMRVAPACSGEKSIEVVEPEDAGSTGGKHRRRGRDRVRSRQSPQGSDLSASEHSDSRGDQSDDEREDDEEETVHQDLPPPQRQSRWRVSILHGDIVAIPSTSEESNLEEVIIDETDLSHLRQRSLLEDSLASCDVEEPLVVEEDSGSSLNSSECSASSEEDESDESWSSGEDGKSSASRERMSDRILEIVMGESLERLVDEDDSMPRRGRDEETADVGLAEQLSSQDRTGQQENAELPAERQLEDADAQFPVLTRLPRSSAESNWTCQAVKQGDARRVEDALRAHADPNVLSSTGLTALQVASLEGKDEILRLLLKAGGDVTVRSKTGLTCLHCAAQEGKASTCKILLCEGIDVNVATSLEKNSALHLAVLNRRSEVVRLLLEHGASCSIVNVDGLTPMDMAKKLKDGNIVEEMRKMSRELPGAQV